MTTGIANVTVFGATGSIGKSTVDVIRRHPDRFRLFAAAANRDVDGMCKLVDEFAPDFVVMAQVDAAQQVADFVAASSAHTEVMSGSDGLVRLAESAQTDVVMAAIVGAAGLESTLAAARAGKRVLLANKESLVLTGDLFMAEVREHGAQLLPIDSEHNAIFQSMPRDYGRGLAEVGVRRILLTASGGPFRETPLDELEQVSVEQAVAHPNWSMGRKISVDSASMMNKGLELIEACWLFDTAPDKVQIVVHPQSIVHSLVEYVDGSVLSQMGNPDMRIPIAHAMGYPDRIESGGGSLDLFKVARLDFQAPDEARFPCLRLAREAMQAGGTSGAILNAANEIAVEAFLNRQIGFLDIPAVIEQTLGAVSSQPASSIPVTLEADQAARAFARERIDDARPIRQQR